MHQVKRLEPASGRPPHSGTNIAASPPPNGKEKGPIAGRCGYTDGDLGRERFPFDLMVNSVKYLSSNSMAENPYLPTDVEAEPRKPNGISAGALIRETLKYLGAYLLGVIACVALTPVEMNMGGHEPLWFLYPILAPIGYFLFYLYLEGAYLPFGGEGPSYWLYASVGLVPFVMEVMAYLLGSRRFHAWRPLWIGCPIGFVGTLGVYYTAAASI
ncbi:hypothetical protein CKO51_24915 [Rhodopirellula sp. SM50]|nr:hypothetical protein [Rhodopirellula sp. SM50]PAY16786.1 hypothetical protein CKO51_24915 [Rhodopirellula sp. SM50]